MNELTEDRKRELAADGPLTIPEAAEFLKIGRTEVYYRIKRGELLTTKIGKRRLVLKRSALELLAKNIVVCD